MRLNIGAQPSVALWDCRFPHWSFSLNTRMLSNEYKWQVDGTDIIDFSISIKTILSENQLTFAVDNTIIDVVCNMNVFLSSICIFYSFIFFSTLQILLMNKTDLFQEKILQSGRHLRFYLSCYKGRIDLSSLFLNSQFQNLWNIWCLYSVLLQKWPGFTHLIKVIHFILARTI